MYTFTDVFYFFSFNLQYQPQKNYIFPTLLQYTNFQKNRKSMSSQKPFKFEYPHPILKTFASVPITQSQHSPPAYQPSHTISSSSLPPKLLASTHIHPLYNATFSLLIHPLHPKVETPAVDKKDVYFCKKCKAVINTQSIKKLSLIQHECLYCGNVQNFDLGSYVDLGLCDVNKENEGNDQDNARKILFVIQANQFLFRKQIVTSIFNCLRALAPTYKGKDQLDKSISVQTERSEQQHEIAIQTQQNIQQWQSNIKIGFMFFDEGHCFSLNMFSNQFVIMKPADFTQQFPLTEQQIFANLQDVNLEDLQQTVHDIMYDSYEIKTSCLNETLSICSQICKKYDGQVKLLVNSHDNSSLKPIQQKSKNQRKLKIDADSRIQIYLMNNNLANYMNGIGLSKNIYKMYDYNRLEPQMLYYHFYHNLVQEIYYNVEVQVKCSNLLHTNSKKFIIPVLSSNNHVVLDFSIPSKTKNKQNIRINQINTLQFLQMVKTQVIQIQLKLNKQTTKVITYQVPQLQFKYQNQPFLFNDQTFFYVMIHKMLNNRQITSMKKSITQKSEQIIRKLIKQLDQLSVPKNLIRFFMYAFMMIESRMCQKKCSNFLIDRHFFQNQGLETVVKKIYPKAYEFYPETRALKFRAKQFLESTVRVIDNGQFIGIVLGADVPSLTLLKLFDTKILNEVLQLNQIPILQNSLNKSLHKCIKIIRELNQLYYLPIKFIQLGSRDFSQEYSCSMYSPQAHCNFFKRLSSSFQ